MRQSLILKPIILLLRFSNLVSYHVSEIRGKFTPIQDWTKELSRYFKTSPEEIIKDYLQKRKETVKLWDKIQRRQLKQIFSFYSETDYFVYRQSHFNRHKSWWDIALALRLKPTGRLCEYGSGIGPVTNWLIGKFPGWNYHLIDLDCPTFKFSRWRFKNRRNVSFSAVKSLEPSLTDKYDVIVCKQVLEHTPNPYTICRGIIKHLNSGGWLFIDFINSPGQENLNSSYQQRAKTLAYLANHLRPIFKVNLKGKTEGYGLYFK
ncbi:class I SAM-dependent methyltransferase [Patescibacteria group bacterium]|nr:class I SAM-dependent methyltransferase [Patescibacteria group bacterium]MBU1499681.1 class I SAM-dependent methyltransferase [Patescibacteria group bacterium]